MKTQLIVVGVLALIGAYLVSGSLVIVNSGHVGVVRTLGAVQMVQLEEGFHFKKPFLDEVEEMDIRLRKAENQASAASKDLQVVSTKVAVQYSLNGPVAPLTYQKIGRRDVVESTLVNPAIMESVKSVTAQYTAEELITKRAEVKTRIQEAISEFIDATLRQKEVVGALSLANVAITDFDFSA